MIAQFQFEYILNMAMIVENDPQDRQAAEMLYEDWESVLAHSSDRPVFLTVLVMKLIGVRAMSRSLHRLKLIRRWIRCHLKRERFDDYYKNTFPG